MDSSREAIPPSLPIGRSGRLEAAGLEAGGDHAVLVRDTGPEPRNRALLSTAKLATGERLVVVPLDEDVDVRVDGDALAIWLGSGLMGDVPRQHHAMPTDVPVWATVIGGALLIVVLLFAVIGSAVAFAWLTSVLG